VDEEAVSSGFEQDDRSKATRLAAPFTGDPLLEDAAAQVCVRPDATALAASISSRSFNADLRANLANSFVL